MATTRKSRLLTAGDLLRLHGKGVRGELIRGVLAETVSNGLEHGEIPMMLGARLLAFVNPGRLGRVAGSDTGVWLERDPDTVREPDVAFFSADRIPPDVRVRGYSEALPNLVVEIVSPSDTLQAVNDKALMWLRYGVTLAWVVNPDTRTVDVHNAGGPVVTLYEGDALDGGEVLPGFSLPVQEIFE